MAQYEGERDELREWPELVGKKVARLAMFKNDKGYDSILVLFDDGTVWSAVECGQVGYIQGGIEGAK